MLHAKVPPEICFQSLTAIANQKMITVKFADSGQVRSPRKSTVRSRWLLVAAATLVLNRFL